MPDEKARDFAVALSQNLISFHKGRCASAQTQKINLYRKLHTDLQYDLDCKDQKIPQRLQSFDYSSRPQEILCRGYELPSRAHEIN
jgi:hypothetical protein